MKANLERGQTLTDTLDSVDHHFTQLITNTQFVAKTSYISPRSPFVALLRDSEDLFRD